MARDALTTMLVVLCALYHDNASQAGEIIGPYEIQAAPFSARLISGGDSRFWLNVERTPIDYDVAFSGASIIADGFANLGTDFDSAAVIEVEFAPGDVVNRPGADLVFFDARFSVNSYAISTELDDFAVELQLPGISFNDTGEDRLYFFGANSAEPFLADVMAAEVDLSDLGVPADAVVSRIRFSTTSGEADPLGIGSLVPEPGTLTSLAMATFVFFRRFGLR